MKSPGDIPEIKRRPQTFNELNVEASLWVLLPKAFVSLLISFLLVLLIFWLRLGELSLFAIALAIFLVVLQILIIVGLRLQNRTELQTTKPLKKDWIDLLGAWWLMACAFGALFGWACLNLAERFPNYVSAFQLGIVFLTIILPLLTMLPNLRYLNEKALYIQLPLLLGVTVLPMLVGITSLISLINRIMTF